MSLREAIKAGANRTRRDLAARATAFTILLLTCMAALCAGVAVQAQYDLSARQGRETARELVIMTRAFAAIALASGRDGALEGMMTRLEEAPHVVRVGLLDETGRVIKTRGAPLRDEDLAAGRAALAGRNLSTTSGGPDVRVASVASFRGRVEGALVVVVSRASVAHAQVSLIVPLFVTMLAFLAVAGPLTYWFVRRMMAPMRSLIDFTGEMNAARLGRQIDIRTGDEFELLANAYNHMMRRLNASMRRIQQLAFVDAATQLPNQERLAREISDAIARAQQEETPVALVLFEFTHLRRVMETLDSDSAQELMVTIAGRIVHASRTVDRIVRVQSSHESPSLVACLRNHDFAVLAPSVTDPSEAARFAQMLTTAMNQPFDWRGHKVHLGAVCGVSVAPRDGKDADTLMRHAMMARTAARTGGAGLKLFTKALDREAVSRVTVEREMRSALERNEFRAFFQPKIDLETGRITSAEALARWVRPDKSIVGPAKFIPAAEENGLIGAVSDAILREACWKAAAWAREGLPIQVAVNVSALQFRNDRFPEHVERILEHAGVAATSLELEITESIAMEDPERTIRLIEALKAKGVRFAIDDFGCGHSSLAALTQLPFDVIKIDQQFVRGLERGDRQAPAIVETILAMARTLDLPVVAEGIERAEEADFLRARGCRYGQGFLYGAAVPPADFALMLRAQREKSAAA